MASRRARDLRMCLLIACVLLGTDGARARAETRTAEQAQAQRHIQQAEAHYRVSDYPAALASYRAAYRLDPQPDLLFNIARCHEVMARLAEAIRNYERYLEEKPQAEDSGLVRSRLGSLRARRAEELARATSRPRTKAPPSALPPHRAGWKLAAGWTALGVGGASLLTGIVFGALAQGKANEFTEGVSQNRTYAALTEVDRAGRRYQTVQIATLVSGGALVAAAAGLLIWERREGASRDARTPAARLVPVVGSAHLGLVASGSF